ncbi:MAG: D-alanyl-D-alanine carboxypeptidase family protein [Alkaliphilus sp.]
MIRKLKLSAMLIPLFSLIICTFTYASPTITGRNAVLIDYTTGEILYGYNAHEVTYPASTTKILTAVLALEKLNLDEIITVDYDIYVPGASMFLLKGESFTVKELIKATLIRSANDAAELLAVQISGSVDEFSKLMNLRARELGARNSNFTNPHGMPDTNHVTTAFDLAMITKHAMSFDLFREIVSTVNLQFAPTELTQEIRIYRNSNRFLWGTGDRNQMNYYGNYVDIKYDLIDGVKTGFTNSAGQCLVSSAIKDDHRLIAVVLGAVGTNIYTDSRSLIDYGFLNYRLVQIAGLELYVTDVAVLNSESSTIPLVTENSLYKALPREINTYAIDKKITVFEDITAPIDKGEILGRIAYSYNDEFLGAINLVANENAVVKLTFWDKHGRNINYLLAFFSIFVAWKIFIEYVRNKRRRRKLLFSKNRKTYNKN